MGTETRYIWIYQRLPPQYHVKLNNPLMGTETLNSPGEKNIPLKSNYVKLNNPLMGTETMLYMVHHMTHTIVELN